MNSSISIWRFLEKSTILSSILIIFGFSTLIHADGNKSQWQFHGVTANNNADASDITKINKKNVKNVELFAIYNIDIAQTPPGKLQRAENAVAGGIAVDKKGRIYLPTTDGRMHVLDSKKTDGTNPDGSNKPKVIDVYDFLLDSRYFGDSLDDGDDIFLNRLQPALSKGTFYAGNYNLFLNPEPALMGIPQPGLGYTPLSQGAVLMAVDAKTGELKWKVILDDNPHTMITNSPVVHKGVIYVALSSEMSGSVAIPPFAGFSAGFDPYLTPGDPDRKSGLMYRNALLALDEKTGALLWKTYVVPEQTYRDPATVVAEDNVGIWSGASSWGGGNFPIDDDRKQIYIGTGEVYYAPQAAIDCEINRLSQPGADPVFGGEQCLQFNQDNTPITAPLQNIPSADPKVTSSNKPLASAVVAFDYKTGKLKWSKELVGFDVWNFACLGFFGPVNPVLCPSYLRPLLGNGDPNPLFGLNFFAKDLDVGEQPMYVRKVKMANGSKQDLLIATTKRADIWALNPDNGDVIWGPASFGPGSLFGGGILWGSATDGKRVYVASTTGGITASTVNDPENKVVPGSCPPEAFNDDGTLNGGIYGAVNLKDGSIAWQRCLTGTLVDPVTGEDLLDENGTPITSGAWYEGPVTVANGVVVVGISRVYGSMSNAVLRAEFVALNAKTGKLLKRLPLNAPGEPSAITPVYQRPTLINDLIILGNGLKDNTVSPLARRLVIYKLPEDDADSSDSTDDSDSSSD